jgi:hypothetical protein
MSREVITSKTKAVHDAKKLGLKPEYAMNHRPVTEEGGAARLHDLTPAFGEDIYGKNAMQYFGTGDNNLDRKTLSVFNAIRNKPDAVISAYRAIPKNVEQHKLNKGDWVTINKEYAKQHGEGALEGNYKIIEHKVPASHLTTNADSFHEQGYYPKN